MQITMVPTILPVTIVYSCLKARLISYHVLSDQTHISQNIITDKVDIITLIKPSKHADSINTIISTCCLSKIWSCRLSNIYTGCTYSYSNRHTRYLYSIDNLVVSTMSQ